jgi:hypothetical protein
MTGQLIVPYRVRVIRSVLGSSGSVTMMVGGICQGDFGLKGTYS